MEAGLQFLVSGLVIGTIYGLAAIAYTTIFNVTGVINFAQGDMVMLPALVGIAGFEAGAGYAGAVALALLVGGLLGALIDWAVVARLRGSALRTTIATIGLGIVLQGVAVLVFGTEAATLPGPLEGRQFHVLGAALPGSSLVVLATAAVLVGGLALLFQASTIGLAFRACALNPYAARLSSIDIAAMRRLAFMLSGVVSAIIGVIVAPITLMQYDTGIAIGIKGFVACIIGGLGNPLGALVGGLFLGVVESFATGLVGSGYKSVVAFVLLIGVLLLRPGGLLGRQAA